MEDSMDEHVIEARSESWGLCQDRAVPIILCNRTGSAAALSPMSR